MEEEHWKKAAELLLKNYPSDKHEYLSEEEVFQTQRKKITDKDDLLYKDEDLLRHLRYFQHGLGRKKNLFEKVF